MANLFQGTHGPEMKTAEGAGTRLDALQSLDSFEFYPPREQRASLAEVAR